ncbi:MAG TPA: xanthine dehydrogenase family protein molybdopterin-binding subunit [Acidimicrobiales bacterium]
MSMAPASTRSDCRAAPAEGSRFVGQPLPRLEDPRMLTSGATFVADVSLPGDAGHVAFVRSPMPHARIVHIDVSQAAALDGVMRVVTAADLGVPDLAPPIAQLNAAMTRPVLAGAVVRFVGEPVVAILADTAATAADAIDLVTVDYQPLPVVVDPLAAATDEVVLHPAAGTNIACTVEARPAERRYCEVVVTRTLRNHRVAPAPLEGRAAAAYCEPTGRLVHISSNQGAHAIRDQLADLFDLDPADVRVVTPDVGGSFGSKARLFPEDVVVAWLALTGRRPVRWVETRSEHMVAAGHGRGQLQTITIGGDRSGRIQFYRLDVLQDGGAYPATGAALPLITRLMTSGVYDIPAVEYAAQTVVTNTVPTVAFRGAGRPEAIFAIERAIDVFAHTIDADPIEIRRRNFIPPSAFPYRAASGARYDTGCYAAALERVLDAADVQAWRAAQRQRRARRDAQQLGIGVASYVEITAIGGGQQYAAVHLEPDGTMRVVTGATPFGQGHVTAWAAIVADRLHVPLEAITVVHGDSALVPSGSITGGSKSVQLAGSSVRDAAERLVETARATVADALECDAADVTLTDSGFQVMGVPARSLSWREVAARAHSSLAGVAEFTQDGSTYPFGAHVAVVEVDIETGKVDIVRLVACDDAGTIVNPLLADGQLHGGLAQGAAQALLEEAVYDADGMPLTTNFADYGIVSATELPSFDLVRMETPTFLNPLGAKGIGESGTIGATPAVVNAVVDALRHVGVDHIDMPCTPERVWRALRDGTAPVSEKVTPWPGR